MGSEKTTSVNIGMDIPIINQTSSPYFETYLIQALNKLDSHDHSTGKGLQISQNSLTISDTMKFNDVDLADVYAIGFTNPTLLGATPPSASIYFLNGNLYIKDGSANIIQLTSGGGINTSALGTISGNMAGSGASVTYFDTDERFMFFSAASSPVKLANVRVGQLEVGGTVGGAYTYTANLQVPTLSASYTYTLPNALPSINSFASINTSGVWSYIEYTNLNTISTVVKRDASGNFSAGTITASLIGNASTASTLQTARTIAGVSFNGSSNIDIDHVNLTNKQGGTTNEFYHLTSAQNTLVSSLGTTGTAHALVQRDASGAIVSSVQTDAVKIPTGTTAQRPTGTTGLTRMNTTIGKIEFYDGSGWKVLDSSSTTGPTLDDLTDVDTAGVTDGQVLSYEESSGDWIPVSISATLEGLTDTTITTPSQGQVLAYDSTTSKWLNQDGNITPLIAGEDLSVGDVVEMLSDGSVIKCLTSADSDKETFESATTTYTSVAKLSATKFIVCYSDGGNSNYGTACILDIVDGMITVGTPTVFESASTDFISVVSLSDTKVLICYDDIGNSNYGTSIILDVSGTTITPATPVVFESAGTTSISATKLSDSQVLVAYRDGGNANYGTACILDVSGSVITAGTPAVFESASTAYISATTLDSTKVLVAYNDADNSGYGTACVLSVSGSTITPATPTVFESASSEYISATTLDSTKALVAYKDAGNSGYGTAIILSISGTTITPTTAGVFESASTNYTSVSALSSTKAVVSYQASSLGNSCVLDISGTTISAGNKTTFESASSTYISSVPISVNRALICYGASSLGKAYTLPIVGSFFGVSASNCLATETCNVKPEGKAYVSGTFSLGDDVYLSNNGQASTTGTGERLGIAIDNSNNVLLRVGNPRANLGTGVVSFTSGSGTWIVPTNVYNIDICVVGGGGGGYTSSSSVKGGNGGDSVLLFIRVSPGDSITYSVGAAGTTSSSPTAGGDSTCSLSSIFNITAKGGNSAGTTGTWNTPNSTSTSSDGLIHIGGRGIASSNSIGGDSLRGGGGDRYNNSNATGYGGGGAGAQTATAGLVEFKFTKGVI